MTHTANPRRGQGAAIRWLREVAAIYQGDDCLIWPFSLNSRGYPGFGVNGKPYRAHRYMCELVHGPAPADKPHAAHSCGIKACCNPRHLSWKTASENEHDKKAHGFVKAGKGSRTNLSADDIAFIRASKGKISADRLALMFGKARTTIFYWWGSTHERAPQGMSRPSIYRRSRKAA